MFKMMSLGKCLLNQDTTAHLLKWAKSKILTMPTVGKDVEPQELSFIAGRMHSDTATLEDRLAVFCFCFCFYNQAKHTFTI